MEITRSGGWVREMNVSFEGSGEYEVSGKCCGDECIGIGEVGGERFGR